jgi:hypothetical protein
MLEILILSAIITAKLFGVDREYAKRGEVPPGYRLIDKWLDGRKARGQAPTNAKPAKPGMWRYFWQRWQALWEILAQDHKIRHEKYLKDRAEAIREGRPKPKKPTFKLRAGAAWQWVVDTIGVPVGGTKPHMKPAPPSEGAPSDDHEKLPAPAAPDPWPATDFGPAPVRDDRDEWADVPYEPWPEPPLNPEPARSGTSTEGEHMTAPAKTQTSGEVIGLTGAIAYADEVASAHGQHSSGSGEQYRASLARAEVGEDTIASAARAQEASAIAQAAWTEHANKLREQLAAKEATTVETGNKEFLLSE